MSKNTEAVPTPLPRKTATKLEKLIYWKATEFRSCFFNWCLPIFSDVLEQIYFDYFSLLVHGVSLLNSSIISQNYLAEASRLLNSFVQQFSDLYGIDQMSHNLHMILHLETCVRLLRPLWAVNCFMFENINGRLTNFIDGTKYVGLQIHTNLSILTVLFVRFTQ